MFWAGGGGYEDAMAVEIEGELAECLTKFTSVVPSAFQRSTVRT